MSLMYPQQGIDTDEKRDELLKIWCDVLSDVEDVPLQIAAAEYMKSAHDWRPAPGVLRARALETIQQDAKSRAELQWEYAVDRMSLDEVGVVAMRRAGGLDAFSMRETDDNQRWHDRFVKEYCELARKQDLIALPEFQALRLIPQKTE